MEGSMSVKLNNILSQLGCLIDHNVYGMKLT